MKAKIRKKKYSLEDFMDAEMGNKIQENKK
jgi:hypothetical protein